MFLISTCLLHMATISECYKSGNLPSEKIWRMHVSMYQFIQTVRSTFALFFKKRFISSRYYLSVSNHHLSYSQDQDILYRPGISIIPYLNDWLVHHPVPNTPESPVHSAANAGIGGFQTECQKVIVEPCLRHPVPQSQAYSQN